MNVTRELLHALPKAELHVHLDGSLRPRTMLELARERATSLPSQDPEELATLMRPPDGGSLESYLETFQLILPLMQDAPALERIAYELAEDAAQENVRYMEVRFSPLLNTGEGLTPGEVLESVLAGLARAGREHGILTGVIVCALRDRDPSTSMELAELALAFRGRGVVALDLAGPEEGHPAKAHREAFLAASRGNLATTVHAGEAAGPSSISQALHECGARRIGHGTRLLEDPDLLAYLRDFRIPLEVCLTSNVQTGTVPSYQAHPLPLYLREGVVLTLNTDSRLVSGTTLTREYDLARERLGLVWDDLVNIALLGFQSAFLPWPEKQEILRRVRGEIAALERD